MGREIKVTSLEQMCDLMCPAPEEHEFCLRCGRKLRSNESRIIGYGAICLQKVKQKQKTSLFN